MIKAITIDIDHPELLSNYSGLLEALDKQDKKSQTNITFDMEKIIAKTVFRGVTVGSSGGKGNPDFVVTNDGLNQLLSKVTRDSTDIDRFNDFVAQMYGSSGTPVEAKIMRAQGDSDIKIGIFTPSVTASNMKYFDFTSGDIIDTTRYSVVDQLRSTFRGDPEAQPPSQKELKKEIKRSDLQAFIKTTRPEFQKIVMMDKDVKALDKILSKTPQQKVATSEVAALVDAINNKWAKQTLDGELTRLNKAGKLFDYVSSVPALKSQFYMKSRLLSIFRSEGSRAKALLLYFPLESFNSKLFGAKYEEGQIKVFIKSDVEKMFLGQLTNETVSLKLTQDMDAYDKAVAELNRTGTFKNIDILGLNTKIQYLIPTGGSIPMSTGNFFNVKRKYKRPPFARSGKDMNIAKYSATESYKKNAFLSSEFLSLLVRQRVTKLMPPSRSATNPKPRPDILTYRTGRFANSIELLVDYRTRVVRYYYNPIYYVHESTGRDPRELITKGISEVLRERFNQSFTITDSTRRF